MLRKFLNLYNYIDRKSWPRDMGIIKIINSKLNKIVLLETALVFVFFLVSALLNNITAQYVIGIIDILLFYILLIVKLIRRKDLSIIEVFIAFLFLYVIGTYIFFNNIQFRTLILNIFVNSIPYPTDSELLIQNTILYVFTKILQLPICDLKFNLRIKEKASILTNKFDFIIFIFLFIFSFFLFYLVHSFSNYYDFLENSGPAFSLIGYFSYILSILIIITDLNKSWKKGLLRTILCLLCIALIAKIGSRTYAIYLTFSLLINLKKRGMRFGNRVFLVFFAIGFFAILYQSIARTGMHGLANSYNKLTLFAEFFLPAYSFFYFVNNPLHYSVLFPSSDFFVKLLPTKILPQLQMDQFINFYSSQNISVAPVGGFFLYGQLIYYFGVFSILFVVLIALYFSFYKEIIEKQNNFMVSCIFPMIFLLVPRQFLYLLPKTIIVIVLIYLLMQILIYSKKKNNI